MDFPIETGGSFHSYLAVDQRVSHEHPLMVNSPLLPISLDGSHIEKPRRGLSGASCALGLASMTRVFAATTLQSLLPRGRCDAKGWGTTRPGKLTKNDGKWPFIVSFPMKNGDVP